MAARAEGTIPPTEQGLIQTTPEMPCYRYEYRVQAVALVFLGTSFMYVLWRFKNDGIFNNYE